MKSIAICIQNALCTAIALQLSATELLLSINIGLSDRKHK